MADPRYVNSGIRLRAARHAAGLRHKDVEAETGISQNVLSNMENGHRGIGPKSAEKLGRVLKVAPETLLSTVPLSQEERRLHADHERRIAALEQALRELREGGAP